MYILQNLWQPSIGHPDIYQSIYFKLRGNIQYQLKRFQFHQFYQLLLTYQLEYVDWPSSTKLK